MPQTNPKAPAPDSESEGLHAPWLVQEPPAQQHLHACSAVKVNLWSACAAQSGKASHTIPSWISFSSCTLHHFLYPTCYSPPTHTVLS